MTPGDDSWFGMSMYERKADVPFALTDELRVCLNRPGVVKIVDVSLEHSIGGLHVDNFGVRPYADDYPTMDTDGHALREYGGFEEGSAEVNVVCPEGPEDEPSMHLGVEFSKPNDATARGANLLITYVSDGQRYVLRREFELILCETDDAYGECDYWEPKQYESLLP